MDVQKRGGLNLINRAVIIPTGDEILNGIVTDTNSPAIMGLILEAFPQCEVTRVKPVNDTEEKITNKLSECIDKGNELIFLIGGSGGGHRYIPTLGKDYTHSALVKFLPDAEAREIYGANGHLWSKLIAAKKGGSIIITVPGPYVEAVAAAGAAIELLERGEENIDIIVSKTAEAVLEKYPSGGKLR